MKKRVSDSGKVKLSKNQLHDLRAAFAAFNQTKPLRVTKVDGCALEIHHSKGSLVITKGAKVIFRARGLTNATLKRYDEGLTMEIYCGGK